MLFALATTFVGASAAAASKYIAADVHVSAIVLSQYTLALLILMPWLWRQQVKQLATQHLKAHLVRGLGGWLCFYTFYLALEHIPLVDASLLRHSAPLFVPLIAWLWLRVSVEKSRWLPMLVGFIGIAIILRPSSAPSQWHIVGLVSGLTLALSMVGTRVLSRTESSSKILFYYNFISVLLSLPLAIYNWQSIPLWTLPYLLYIGMSVFLAMWFYTKAYSYAKASVISPIGYFSVVNAGLFGWFIWDHVPDTIALIGIAVVISAGLISVFLSARER